MTLLADKRIALRAVRNRAASLADAVLRAELAQAQFAVALNAAERAGATQDDVDQQVKLAAVEKPERGPALERLRIVGEASERVITTPHDDPIVQACVDNGGHFWPDGYEATGEPPTCTRCWFNPSWVGGQPRDESNVRPITDDPRGY